MSHLLPEVFELFDRVAIRQIDVYLPGVGMDLDRGTPDVVFVHRVVVPLRVDFRLLLQEVVFNQGVDMAVQCRTGDITGIGQFLHRTRRSIRFVEDSDRPPVR